MSVIQNLLGKILEVRGDLIRRSTIYSTDACLIDQVCKVMTLTANNISSVAKAHQLPKEFVPDASKDGILSIAMRRSGSEIIAVLERLLLTFNNCRDRLKSEDIYHRQLDLALKIGKVMSGKKLQYFKNAYIHLATECLKQLRCRDLYSVIPLENHISSCFPEEIEWEDIKDCVLTSLNTEALSRDDKIRLIALFQFHVAEWNSRQKETVLEKFKMSDDDDAIRVLDMIAKLNGDFHFMTAREKEVPGSGVGTDFQIRSRKRTLSSSMRKWSFDHWTKMLSLDQQNQHSSSVPKGVTDPLGITSTRPPEAQNDSVETAWYPLVYHLVRDSIRQNRDSACLSHFKQFDRRKKSWNTAKSAGKQFSSKKSHSTNFLDESDKDDTIVVFLIGGITFSEIRHINMLQKKYPSHKILIGSTHCVTAESFLQEMEASPLRAKL